MYIIINSKCNVSIYAHRYILIVYYIKSLSRTFHPYGEETPVKGNLSEIRGCWIFRLTPLPNLRPVSHKVIREILPELRPLVAIKMG